jgi:phosphoglycolate phosphatase
VLFIFDWDGTLCDSTAKITEAMQLAAIDMGWQPLPSSVICNIIGLGLPEAILALYPSVTEQQRAQIRDRYAVNFLRLEGEKASLFFPFVAETLSNLRKQGHLLAVATGKSRRGLDRVLLGFGLEGFFDATRCADETASKPNPLMLEELLTQFNVSHSNAVMVGDTEYDMDMARSIDMPRIAVSYGAHHVDRLRPYLPELCVDSIDEILQWHRLN